MSDKTGIEWTDATWNPIRGCSRVSEGCRNCYAETQAARIIAMDRGRGVEEGRGAYDGLLAKGGQWNGSIRLVHDSLDQPLRWRKPRRIFVNSMSDLFHENVADRTIQQIFAIMAAAPQHTFQILTKRPQRMLDLMSGKDARWIAHAQVELTEDGLLKPGNHHVRWPLPNVWLGVSVEDQSTADERVPILLETPAALRWVSAEPLLGAVTLRSWLESQCPWGSTGALDWVVVGGESGRNARPMHPHWLRGIRDECLAAEVPFLFKQWGEYNGDRDATAPIRQWEWMDRSGQTLSQAGSTANMGPIYAVARVGKRAAGRRLDGVTHDDFPGLAIQPTGEEAWC